MIRLSSHEVDDDEEEEEEEEEEEDGKRTCRSIMASYRGRALSHNSCSRLAMASFSDALSRRDVMDPASPR